MKYYFTDTTEFSYTVDNVNERADGTRALRLEGVFQKAGVKNANGRMYPREILEREIDKHENTLSEKRMLGEIDHPSDPRIHLDKASHAITELKMDEDGIVYGSLEVLQTPAGKLLESLIRSGVKLGISSRGTGSVKEDKDESANIVQDDYNLITFDIVADPSTPGAWPEMVKESVDGENWVDPGVLKSKTETAIVEEDERSDAFNDCLVDALDMILKKS